jgi:hypothetical protein
MIRIATIAAAALAFAGAAQAASITVPVAGKDTVQVHKAIVLAAQNVCADALSPSPLRYYAMSNCVADAVTQAESQLTKSVAANAAVHGRDAAEIAKR